MKNKLFIVCPFSNMEIFIRQKYGEDSFFMTSIAAVLNIEGKEISALNQFIDQEKIQEIILASDTSCRFINAALRNEKQFGSFAEIVIKNTVLENKDALSETKDEEERRITLASAVLRNQAKEMYSPISNFSKMSKNKITLKGIITSKSKKKIIEINFTNN